MGEETGKLSHLGLAALVAGLLFTSCISGGSDAQDADSPGQITRPGNVELALDDPGAVRAFDAADLFLVDWFILNDAEAAAEHISLNLRPFWESLLNDTEIEGTCSFRQVEGEALDASGTTVVRYSIDGCLVSPPGGKTATHINVMVTVTETSAWVVQIEFD